MQAIRTNSLVIYYILAGTITNSIPDTCANIYQRISNVMEPLSTTASVIAIATLVAHSCKATYALIDGLVGAPHVIANLKYILSGTEKTLDTLRESFAKASKTPETSRAVEITLRGIPLDDSLKLALGLCREFNTTITTFTKHSTEGRLSTRDRLEVQLGESKINKLDKQLGDCQRTVSLVLDSINLYVLSQTSPDPI